VGVTRRIQIFQTQKKNPASGNWQNVGGQSDMNRVAALAPLAQPVPQAPLSTPADGVYVWHQKDPVCGSTRYEAHIKHGRLVLMDVNGIKSDIQRQLNQIEELVFSQLRQHKHEKVA
jgi:hypothetical protein